MKLWLGIDVGTTGTRAVLVDAAGAVHAAATAEHGPIEMQRPSWAEQNTRDWWQASKSAISELLGNTTIERDSIAGIGVAGQMHGLVLLDSEGQVLGNSIIWCDQRSQEQTAFIQERIGLQKVIEHTCNPPLTGFTAPKLIWVREHRTELYEKSRMMQLPKDYIRFCLTSEYATDLSDASGTGLFNVAQRCWSREMISSLGFETSLFPPAYESTAVVGKITATAAQQTGLRAGTPVVAGAGDQAAGGVGTGVVKAGLISATIGTSGVVFASSESPVTDRAGRIHTFCHAVPGSWHVMGVTQGAGLSLRWFRDNFFGEDLDSSCDPYEVLCESASTAPAGAGGALFLPYLMGERTPHLDPKARGGWIGLTAAHTRGHLVRAILEGVAFSLRDTLEIFRQLGISAEQIRLSGGGSRSPLWREIMASVFETPVVQLRNSDGAAYGAALLAMVGTGHFATVAEACAQCVATTTQIEPNPEFVPVYAEGYRIYKSLYPLLAGVMHQLADSEQRVREPAAAGPTIRGSR